MKLYYIYIYISLWMQVPSEEVRLGYNLPVICPFSASFFVRATWEYSKYTSTDC